MSEIVEAKPARQSSLLAVMAERYHMDPQTFATTVRKTAMPSNATNEEFAAFMMVAKEYNLNPILKEIHAFPKKGGGIQPVVSIDGWVSLINQHPELDGYSFEWTDDAKGDPISCKCIMYRKDRKHPVVVEEYLAECIRPTDPWKMKRRMLRHKALIQAARYAFGFSGVMDEDEAGRIAAMRDVTPPPRPKLSDFENIGSSAPADEVDPETGEVTEAAAEAVDGDPAPEAATAPAEEAKPASDADLPQEAAYRRGTNARRQGVAFKAVPPEYREDPALSEAWKNGWKDLDKMIAADRAANANQAG